MTPSPPFSRIQQKPVALLPSISKGGGDFEGEVIERGEDANDEQEGKEGEGRLDGMEEDFPYGAVLL